MAQLLAAAITSFVIASLIIPVVIKYSIKKNLVDIPGRRKIHKKVTPSLGGIAIFIGFFFSILVWLEVAKWQEIKYLLVPFVIIFFTGVRDDLVPVRAWTKLAAQLLAAGLLVVSFDLRLISFYSIWNIELPLLVSYAITIFTIIVIVNSFNLIDGLDGLAGTISIISCVGFGVWFYFVNEPIYATLSFSMAGGILAFLIFNWEPSEIFMGDTGAMVIGLLLAVQIIKFINVNFTLPEESTYKFGGSVSAAACFIIVPLVDTMRIFILRLSKGKSPFSPDKSHIHHALMRLGFSHRKVTTILGLVQFGFILLALVLSSVNDRIFILIVIGLAIGLSVLLDRLILRRIE